MTIRTIIYKNIIKRKSKTALIVFGLALAVSTLVSVVTINQSIQATVDQQLDEYGFNIIVSPKTESFSLDYGGVTLGTINQNRVKTLGAREIGAIKALQTKGEIKSYSPKLLDVAEINGRRALLAGVDLAVERRVKDWWVIEAGRYPKNRTELFVGEVSAERLGIAFGDRIDLYGQQFTVAGILMETGSQDDTIIFIDLKKLRELTGKGTAVSLIDVAATTTEDVKSVTSALAGALPGASVRSVQQAVEIKGNALGFLLQFGLGINAIIIGITGLIVFTITASSVNERKAEIGIFRAIGWRRRSIMAVILGEVLLLGAVGGVGGYFLGFGLAKLLPLAAGTRLGAGLMSPSMGGGIDPTPAAGAVALSPVLLLIAVSVAIGISLLAGLVPARRAADLDPATALKSL